MRTGYTEDWFGQATQKIIIVAETTDGRYVCKHPSIIVTRLDGSTYEVLPMTGLFLRDKSEVTLDNENVEGDKKDRCPFCGAHKLNYLETLHVECQSEHGG